MTVMDTVQYAHKRFGAIALENGFVTIDQLVYAVNVQIMEDMLNEERRPLGTIMCERGFMTEKQLGEVLESQRKGPGQDLGHTAMFPAMAAN